MTRSLCARCLLPIFPAKRRWCSHCRRNYHHVRCWRQHRAHAHTTDDRAAFNNRRFWKRGL